MLALSTKSHYGLCAILEIAGNYGSRLTQAREIVEKYKIPQPYLEQLLNRLSKSGIIKSIRGKNGGYDLAAYPSEITLLNVLEALEGDWNCVNGVICFQFGGYLTILKIMSVRK